MRTFAALAYYVGIPFLILALGIIAQSYMGPL